MPVCQSPSNIISRKAGEADATVVLVNPGGAPAESTAPPPPGLAAGIGGASRLAAANPYLGGVWSVVEAVRNTVEVWAKGAKKFERMGEFIERIGWPKFFELTGIEFEKEHIDDYKHAGLTYKRSAQIRQR